ncbi:uncharacterized protein I303_100351 [Kwoniella dejecticola CBS 10117]|uniref:Ion transport domain-containing protein n=1 Tax=Kwoniella dejecticola CBS 10117 TaxID=1296121 RepID=A0A1A6AEQ9_9TREE|nr:uncharacterized protein I303_00351 [Kwoniella dejecticola CBS 10117]OBR88534.1 hypothetical protein I303_00351 [Kwoniella dejecticola CBS 10117]
MPRDEEISAEDFEFDEDTHTSSNLLNGQNQLSGNTMPSTRSQYHLPASEQLRGVANRIIFSRYYILFYGAMMGLSFATLVISLIATHGNNCPPAVWHILEVVINVLMVLEVGTRWIAYGKKYPLTLLNIIDIILVLFCTVTLILVFRNPCGEGTRSEELLDTFLLIIRNTVQFLRLGSILRRSGHSLFNPPKPIDLSQAGQASLALNLELDDDEEVAAERQLAISSGGRTLRGINASGSGSGAGGGRYQRLNQEAPTRPSDEEERVGVNVKNNAGRENLTGDDEDMWDRL